MAFPSKQTASAFAPAAQKAAALLSKQDKKEPVVGEKTKAAIEAMVFEGKHRKEAAADAGMVDESLRQMLLKPHVLLYLNQCMEVLRTSERPRSLLKVVQLRDKAGSERVQLDAAKYIDGMDRGAHQVGATVVNNTLINNTVNVTPGYVLDLRPDQHASSPQIEHLGPHGDNDLEVLIDVPEPE